MKNTMQSTIQTMQVFDITNYINYYYCFEEIELTKIDIKHNNDFFFIIFFRKCIYEGNNLFNGPSIFLAGKGANVR